MNKYKGVLYLIGLLVIVPWFVYSIAISDTVRANRELKMMGQEIAHLQSRRRQGNTVGAGVIADSKYGLQGGDIIPRLMDCVSGVRCMVVEYTPFITESRDGLVVHTAELVLDGAYADLVRLIERAETELSTCRLVSVSFKRVKQRQRKQPQLNVTLILQQITKNP